MQTPYNILCQKRAALAAVAVGELSALEEVVGQLTSRGLLRPLTLKALWLICSNAHDQLIQQVSEYIAPVL